jgi:hypothetical protein
MASQARESNGRLPKPSLLLVNAGLILESLFTWIAACLSMIG